jgi:hypothetical protein
MANFIGIGQSTFNSWISKDDFSSLIMGKLGILKIKWGVNVDYFKSVDEPIYLKDKDNFEGLIAMQRQAMAIIAKWPEKMDKIASKMEAQTKSIKSLEKLVEELTKKVEGMENK